MRWCGTGNTQWRVQEYCEVKSRESRGVEKWKHTTGYRTRYCIFFVPEKSRVPGQILCTQVIEKCYTRHLRNLIPRTWKEVLKSENASFQKLLVSGEWQWLLADLDVICLPLLLTHNVYNASTWYLSPRPPSPWKPLHFWKQLELWARGDTLPHHCALRYIIDPNAETSFPLLGSGTYPRSTGCWHFV